MKTGISILVIALALAGCSASPTISATNASASDVAKQLSDSKVAEQMISPGRWESTISIKDVNIPGAPPQAIEKMRTQLGGERVSINCLTAEDVKRPKEQFFSQIDKSCRYDRFTMGGGKIDAKMQCANGNAKRTMTMAGTYSPDKYSMSVTTTGDADKNNPMAGMSMRMEMNAKRTGECTAADKAKPSGATL